MIDQRAPLGAARRECATAWSWTPTHVSPLLRARNQAVAIEGINAAAVTVHHTSTESALSCAITKVYGTRSSMMMTFTGELFLLRH